MTFMQTKGQPMTLPKRAQHDLDSFQAGSAELSSAAAKPTAEPTCVPWVVDPRSRAFNLEPAADGCEKQGFPVRLVAKDQNRLRDALESILDGLMTQCDLRVRIGATASEWEWVRVIGAVQERDLYGLPSKVGGLIISAEPMETSSSIEASIRSLTHDLKSPLVTILGFADHLKQDFVEQDYEDATYCTDRIVIAANRMDELVTSLRKYF